MTGFDDVVDAFARSLAAKSATIGDPEANLRTPIVQFLEQTGSVMGFQVTPYDEVRELEGRTRLDWAIAVDGLLTGWVEVKNPTTSIDPERFAKSSHNYRQWQALKELPNLMMTNGREWRLYRNGELVGNPTGLELKTLRVGKARVNAAPGFEATVQSFLGWEPAEIKTVSRLVPHLASLTRATREAVRLQLTAERQALKAGADLTELVFMGALRDWRKALFPNAKDSEFADGFAQTVTFALLLAVSEGIPLSAGLLVVGSDLRKTSYGLMGQTLDLLTRHIGGTAVDDTIDTLVRVLSVVRWDLVSAGSKDLYLHLYEAFLSEYDPELREASGSYYTPLPVVESMVRLVDDVLRRHLGRERGYRDPQVAVIDPAMGTGTYPLAVIRHVAEKAVAEYGPGASAEAASSMAGRLFGMELQTGPFAVAELRLAQSIRAAGATVPKRGLGLYVADTLEDPQTDAADLSYDLALIARQRMEANGIKRGKNITVVIGNPPYDDSAAGRGGWVESGRQDGPTALMDAFKTGVPGSLTRKLKNLYTFFWRWGTWKVFESTADIDLPLADQGVVCFITPLSYTTSDAYAGMREYLRRKCTHGWVINLSPEGHLPDVPTRVFPKIKTELAIGIFARAELCDEDRPAKVLYTEVRGLKAAKFDLLQGITLDSERWSATYQSWRDPFTPAPSSEWATYPKLGDVFPWSNTGVTPTRNWVYSPSVDTLYSRLTQLISESSKELRDKMFHVSTTCTPYKAKKPLPGVPLDTSVPFDGIDLPPAEVTTEIIQYRSFDQQYIIADSRLIDRPCPSLWEARNVPGQLFFTEQHNYNPGSGPGLFVTNLLPDQHCFNSRGGRVLPLFHPDGTPNIAPALLDALSTRLGMQISPDCLANYVIGVVGSPAYTEVFQVELNSPGVRVPLTADRALFAKAAELGARVRWCMSLGRSGDLAAMPPGDSLPAYEKAVGPAVPASYSYDREGRKLIVGEGRWSNVAPEVISYEVGGRRVIASWLEYRLVNLDSKVKNPLDSIVESRWLPEWSEQLTVTLRHIAMLTNLEPLQKEALGEVLDGATISLEELAESGAPPVGEHSPARKARRRVVGGRSSIPV